MIHKLKTWLEYFGQGEGGAKTFEIRFNDRDYQTGDILVLEEYDPVIPRYTGKSINAIVSYILSGQPFVPDGYICMAIHKI